MSVRLELSGISFTMVYTAIDHALIKEMIATTVVGVGRWSMSGIGAILPFPGSWKISWRGCFPLCAGRKVTT